MNLDTGKLRALTLDLDDTLWPIWPTIARAESALQAWLQRHAPRVTERFDLAAMRADREAVARERPDWAHDLSALRRESIRRLLVAAGETEALLDAAFSVFLAERQCVDLYADSLPALQRLAARWPLFALSNGNADLVRIGLQPWFRGSLAAREFGVGKPDPRIFAAACERLGCAPNEVLHVGDDLRLDVHGALDAGMQAAWVRRDGEGREDDVIGAGVRCWQGPDLLALADRLGV
ncbi:HAD family hydrolase [Methylibium petroleiphilum]|uniref:Hydrolase n=1 Tax=Methylibium petroleiphilum (strain ATCC BAA-1232 / LMG 22953 / PM1) TaxID=420662 RepID=A2SIQ9_METPP|nr:HAD-IA family hydrolase [Methylibium petroleiphilum]ABM95448.1 hydrolase [Methylibium petroleiphilum PM1]